MNALCYKIVFSKRLGALVAVGEHTAGQGKAAGTGVRTAVFHSASATSADNFVGLLKSIFAVAALSCVTTSMATAVGPAINTLPMGANVVSGNVAISSTSSAANATMDIKQNTDKASINWQSFSIGSGAAVNIQQNSSSSVLLNRVVGNDPSQIFGKLTANGQVILINPNGVVFGKGGSVTASAFTASTFGMTEEDFKKGKNKFTRNGSTAGVTVEEGATINTTAPGGYVALIASNVNNQGRISTQQGAVVLAAGESVALPSAMTDNVGIPLSNKVRLELAPSAINASVENGGTITTAGGQVLMQAAAIADAVASITHTGNIDTTDNQGGAVTLLADHGNIKITGSIKANSTADGNKGGDIIIGRDDKTDTETGKLTTVLAAATDVSGARLESEGGFVETSGEYLATDGVAIKAAQWLLDPSDITISNGSNNGYASSSNSSTNTDTYTPVSSAATSVIRVKTIEDAINSGTSVTITTTNTNSSGSGAGNITIANALNFVNNSGKEATLKLIADNGITQNGEIKVGAVVTQQAAEIKASGSSNVHIVMNANGNYLGNLGANSNSKGITLNSNISTNGDVTLDGTSKSTSSDGVRFGNGAGIKAAKITVKGNATAPSPANANYSGISFNGTNIFESTGSSTSTFEGKSSTLSNTSAGVMASDAAKLTLQGNIELDGINTNPGYRGLRIGGGGGDANETTTVGNITFKNSLETSQVLLRGKLTAEGTVSFKGGSHVDIYDGGTSINAKNGATVNLESKTVLLGEAGGASIKTDGTAGAGFTLNINTDRLAIRTNTGSESSVNTGSGTTNISTYTTGKEILLGADDITASPTKMGLTNLELGRITGRKLVIGDMVKAGNITVSGTTTTAATTGDITLQTGGKIDVNNALIVNGGQLMLNAKGNVNINANIVKNGNGDVVLAAGSNEDPFTGGQVTAASGRTVKNDNGKIFIYSGSAGKSAGLTGVHSEFSGGFKVTDNANQNTDTNVAFPSSGPYGITGSAAKAQVMFREKLAIDLGVLSGANFNQVYGQPATQNTTAAQTTLLSLAQNALITANSLTGNLIDVTSGSGSSAVVIKVDKGLVVKSMTGNLASPSWSGSDYLNANSDGYAYGQLSSTKYTVTPIAAEKVKVIVNQANLTKVTASKTYDGLKTVAANQMTSIKGVNGETFTASAGTAVISGKDVAGNKTIDDLSGLTLAGVNGGVSSNYKLSSGLPSHGIDNKVEIGQATLTEVSGAKTYDGTKNLANGTLTIKGVQGEEFTTTLASVNITNKNVADNATNKVTNIASLALTGKNDASIELAGNYNLAVDPSRNKVEISAKDVTYSGISVNSKEYDGNRTAGLNGAAALATVAAGGVSTDKKVISTDTVFLNGTLIGAFDSKNVLGTDGLGSNLVRLTGLSLDGVHASNYNLVQPDPIIANNKITPRSLTAIYAANNKEFDGSKNAIVAGILKDVVLGDAVTPSHASATFGSADVGNNKTVTVSGIKLVGADASNYKVDPTKTTKANITAVTPPAPISLLPTNASGSRVKIPTGSSNPFALASAEDLTDDTCSANSIENCHCEESSAGQGIDICYEPHN